MTERNGDPKPLPDVDVERVDQDACAPDADTLFTVLSEQTRRHALWYLLDSPRTTIDELADVLVGWRASESVVVEPADREDLLISLYHVHLPMLTDCDIVVYDADSGEIRLSTLAGPVRELIRFGCRYEAATDGAEID